jgi:phosphoenolpyruvate carboxykinase (GTP)
MSKQQFEKLQSINIDEMKAEMLGIEELYLKLAGDMPKEMVFQRELLIARL